VLMRQIIGWSAIAIFGVLFAINAAFMLASPRAWFRSPWWKWAHGSLTEDKYASGWGAIQVRLAGAGFLAVIAWVLYDALLRPRIDELWVLRLQIVSWCICAVVSFIMVINAAFMLASPRAWFRLPPWIRTQGPLTADKYASGLGAGLVRVIGGGVLAFIGWLLYNMILKAR